jgi:hypothetical protein
LVCYPLNQVDNLSLNLYKYPPTGENQSNTLYM